ncbi:glycosyltransferase family 2 protein [Clostridium magnum]|uniref:GalNAc(5)-diNAcBac-PP-undecaprenol beta-1,3-glucosyltransferase n=1 Tax=Clostridium magnum DSM 2767 TaxID=1121326 RepID=A0A162UA77_9CLOT|nr:glycosyltransferase family 2 protein [Clostridium magnum]KZL93693.1 GalNAc(5)-diNAcBac-PP-undecaprenol beta-1,3-glucosyltransferase [Clostridium magnum DSM 2767]SHI10181.1 Glycosyl transferase family 2 [Clostridium magnum DSM 2767]
MNLDNNDPLVSVLIPAYNRPHFLKIALESALNQTYKNLEIIICDDSTNYEVKNMIQPYLAVYSNLKYFNNAETVGRQPRMNHNRCFNLASGEYVNFLHDDDVFYPKKIERMVEFLKNEEITIVTSRRSLIDKDGNVLPDASHTRPISTIDKIYDGKEIARKMILKRRNFIGEPTTVSFRKKDIDEPGVFMGRKYRCNYDMATWATLLLKGKFVYIAEILSSYRIHGGQRGRKSEVHKMALKELKYLLEDGVKAGIIRK